VGTTAPALLIAAAVVVAAATAPANAESCTGITKSGGRFATCFDNGNRASITAGTAGFGMGVAIRHTVKFDDEPDLVWKLEHAGLEANHAVFEDRFTGVVYRGRFLRHARDGHIVIPLGTPKKVFLPFDVGAFAEVGRIDWWPDRATRIGVIKAAPLIDLARTRDFKRRIAIGPLARWQVQVEDPRDPLAISDHVVSPFSAGLLELHLESSNGRTTGDVRIEAGSTWHTATGWEPEARAEATVERIVLAINDRPIALTLNVAYESATSEATAGVGARIVLFHRRDPRVSLDPPGGR
jgi:hypothetical protein